MSVTRGASQRGAPLSVSSLLGRMVALAFIDAIALLLAYGLWGGGLPLAAVVLLAVTALINVAFLVDRLYPLRWISPGLLLLVLMVVYPLMYTGYIALTNYGQGHVLSKQQVIDRLESQTFSSASPLQWRAYRAEGDRFLIWLTDDEGRQFIGDPATSQLTPVDPADPRFGPLDPEDGLPTSIDGYQKLARMGTIRYLSIIDDYRFQSEIDGAQADIRITSLDAASLGQQKYSYDAARDVIVDHETGTEYVAREGNFVAPDGTRLEPGFADVIGPANFLRALNDPNIRGPFLGVLIWNVTFAALTVVFAFVLGMALAMVLNDKQLPAKGLFRTLTIIPYTIPGFIAILVWVGLMNPLYGPVNVALQDLIGISPRWFSDGTLAKVLILFINTWLGYPYMLLITLGALQSIPSEIYEAAEIDGASAFQRFRRITFPLLLVALAPLLIGAFAFNFNNFVVIDLVTEGGPATPGANTPAGQTDILITYSYRLAFAAGRGQDYAFAAAISLFIFVIVAAITLVNFRLSRRVTEVL